MTLDSRLETASLVPARVARGLRGAVASPQYMASQAGLSVMRAGGSAVDAAIATNAALSVVAAHSCGLGGDAFWLIWDGSRIHALNGSGRSAAGATLDAARAAGLTDMPFRGPWTVTTPGAIRSWADAHARFGRLPWAAVIEPAVELADGFAATAGWCATVERAAEAFGDAGDWAATFRPHGRPWRVGERVSLPNLAGTLRRIAAEGGDVAYEGTLARQAVEYLASRGSPLRLEDFATHRSEWTGPISISYRGLTSVTHPPNSSGVTALQMLGMLERFEPPAAGTYSRQHADARWVHIGLEAARVAMAERYARLTDPEAMPADAVAAMLEPSHLDALAAQIDERRATAAAPAIDEGDTIALMTADSDGMLVSLIESNFNGFGSGLVDPQTGIGYQNRGRWFRFDPANPNVLAPRKRTAHTLTPGMLLRDGRPWLVHGSMGGEIQPLVFAQLVSAVVDGGLDISAAVSGPRWITGLVPDGRASGQAVLESRFAAGVVEGLRERGHDVELIEPFSPRVGHEQAIEVVEVDGLRSFAGASDPRSEGAALAW
jgi:gamma-glutamyltranspeptidase / glutathione hydrolase